MAHVEIRLFGPLSILREGQPITTLQGRKGRDLLSYLALRHAVPHSREQLAALFWGDRDEKHARHCFNTALWRLQTALDSGGSAVGHWLRVDGQTVTFCPDATITVDVVEFEQRCGLADGLSPAEADRQAALWRSAIDLYRGDLLTDCYEDWCLADRERLQRRYVRSLRRLVQYYRQRGEFGLAIDDAQRILACDPLREEVHRDLIHLYIAAGQPTAALRQYRACLDALKRELGVAPMEETTLLVQHLLYGSARGSEEPAPAAILPAGPPHALSGSLGEGVEMMLQVCQQLRDIASTLELVAAGLATLPAPPSTLAHIATPGHPQRQVFTGITSHLGPVVGVGKHGAKDEERCAG